MPTADNPPTWGPPPPPSSPSLDNWCRSWGEQAALVPRGASHPMSSAAGQRFQAPYCRVIDEGSPSRVVGTAGFIARSFPGDQVAPADIVAARRPLAPDPRGEWTRGSQQQPEGRRPFSRRQPQSPETIPDPPIIG